MNEDEEKFEDYPQDFVDKMDDLKGKARKSSKVSMFEISRYGYDQIETPSGVSCGYDIERKKNGRKKS